VLLKFWKPKTVWHFKDEVPPSLDTNIRYSLGQIIRAWSPFILLTVLVIAWGIPSVKDALNSVGLIQFEIPTLHNVIQDRNGNPLAHIYKFNYLSASGTAILISCIIAIPLVGLSLREGFNVFVTTLQQLKFPVVTIGAVLGFAYIVNASGITITLAEALANTGFLFPFFAPVLGWLGVFITGSDTSANALFARLQYETATSIGVDPVVTVAANASGGVVGKMISPQSIAVAAAAGNLVGQESQLFRLTVKHSFYMLIFICFIVLAQAYWFSWLIPTYEMIDVQKVVTAPDASAGFIYLIGFAALLLIFVLVVLMMARGKIQVPQAKV